MWPTLSIETSDWNKTTCWTDSCEDHIPLTANLQLNIKTYPCPLPYLSVSTLLRSLGRDDELDRGSCSCGSIEELRKPNAIAPGIFYRPASGNALEAEL